MAETKEIQEELQPILQKAQDDPENLALIVFGSYARGETFRDIDVCLVLYPGRPAKKVIDYVSAFPEKFDFSIFNLLPLPIQHRVRSEGILLLNKDYNVLFDIYIHRIHKSL
jgi:predicted nucleotidyltransferase